MQARIDFDPPAEPAHNGRDTSVAAAASIRDSRGRLLVKVWCFVHGRGPSGATREEICDALKMRNNTCCPRVLELMALGQLIELEAKRPTSSGRMAHILVTKGNA